MEKNLLFDALTDFSINSTINQYLAITVFCWGVSFTVFAIIYPLSTVLSDKSPKSIYKCRMTCIALTALFTIISSVICSIRYIPSPITNISEKQYKAIIKSDDILTPTDHTVVPVQLISANRWGGVYNFLAKTNSTSVYYPLLYNNVELYKLNYIVTKGTDETASSYVVIPSENRDIFMDAVNTTHVPITFTSYKLNEEALKVIIPNLTDKHIKSIKSHSELSTYSVVTSIGKTSLHYKTRIDNIPIKEYEDIKFNNSILEIILTSVVFLVLILLISLFFVYEIDAEVVKFDVEEYYKKYRHSAPDTNTDTTIS